MINLGDFDVGTTIYGKFTTFRPSTGAPYALIGVGSPSAPSISVFKNNSATVSASGITFSASFNSMSGLNHFTIDTSQDATFYAAGGFFQVVITDGAVDSVSLNGAVVASFTLRADSALKPTTAGRTLDVSAGGEAGVDWANVGSPTTTVALTGTTIDLIDGAIVAATFGAGAIDAAAIAANAIDAATFAADVDAEVRSWLGLASANLDTQLDALPTNAELATALGTADDAVLAAISSMVTYVDTEVAAILAIAQQLEGMTELGTGSPTYYRWKTGALETAPTGGSAPTVGQIADEVQTRTIAGVTTVTNLTNLPTKLDGMIELGSGSPTYYRFAEAAVELANRGTHTTAELNAIADAFLNRDMSTGTDSGSTTVRTPRQALRFLRNKWSISSTTLTVYKEDDSTSSWTGTVTGTAGADPITASDPAGP